jgi:hypothetical protein
VLSPTNHYAIHVVMPTFGGRHDVGEGAIPCPLPPLLFSKSIIPTITNFFPIWGINRVILKNI